MSENNVPKLMTIRQVAKTGLIPEKALRQLVKQGIVKVLYSGNRAFVNYRSVCNVVNHLTA